MVIPIVDISYPKVLVIKKQKRHAQKIPTDYLNIAPLCTIIKYDKIWYIWIAQRTKILISELNIWTSFFVCIWISWFMVKSHYLKTMISHCLWSNRPQRLPSKPPRPARLGAVGQRRPRHSPGREKCHVQSRGWDVPWRNLRRFSDVPMEIMEKKTSISMMLMFLFSFEDDYFPENLLPMKIWIAQQHRL